MQYENTKHLVYNHHMRGKMKGKIWVMYEDKNKGKKSWEKSFPLY